MFSLVSCFSTNYSYLSYLLPFIFLYNLSIALFSQITTAWFSSFLDRRIWYFTFGIVQDLFFSLSFLGSHWHFEIPLIHYIPFALLFSFELFITSPFCSITWFAAIICQILICFDDHVSFYSPHVTSIMSYVHYDFLTWTSTYLDALDSMNADDTNYTQKKDAYRRVARMLI